MKYIKLSQTEKTFYKTNLPYVSTLTWFDGDYQQAHEFLIDRLKIIIQKNPWLIGRIAKRKDDSSGLYIAHPINIDTDESNNESATIINIKDYIKLVPEEESPISRSDSPLGELGKLCKKYLITTNGLDEPLLNIVLIPCQSSPKTKFALICQLSHVIGDGATFYKLHEMLCSSNSGDSSDSTNNKSLLEEELIVERVETFEQDTIKLVGKREYEFVNSPSYICLLLRGIFSSLIFGPKTEFKFAFIDDDKIQKEKDNYLLGIANNNNKNNNKDHVPPPPPPFISTNDIITSWFMTYTKSAYGIMLINLRNRLKGITSNHVGNYESNIFYNCPTDTNSPLLIRKSISTNNMKRVVTYHDKSSFPGFWNVVSKSCAIVTNWSTFAKPNVIPDCKEDLHLPIAPISTWSSTMPFLLVFRAGAGSDSSSSNDDGGDGDGGSSTTNKDRIGVCLFQTRVNYLSSMPFLSKKVFE